MTITVSPSNTSITWFQSRISTNPVFVFAARCWQFFISSSSGNRTGLEFTTFLCFQIKLITSQFLIDQSSIYSLWNVFVNICPLYLNPIILNQFFHLHYVTAQTLALWKNFFKGLEGLFVDFRPFLLNAISWNKKLMLTSTHYHGHIRRKDNSFLSLSKPTRKSVAERPKMHRSFLLSLSLSHRKRKGSQVPEKRSKQLRLRCDFQNVIEEIVKDAYLHQALTSTSPSKWTLKFSCALYLLSLLIRFPIV